MAKLDQINIVAADLAASAAFYRRLGVVYGEADADAFHIGGAAGDDFALDLDAPWFAKVWNTAWAGEANLAGRVVVGFSVESREAVDAVFAELTGAGAKGLAPPWDAFWGCRYAIVEDPDGVAVGLMSPRDPEKSYWPPKNWPEGRT